jgi:hypothetical protein
LEILGVEALLDSFGNAIKPQMNMSIYRDNFECACGRSHWFDQSIQILCEGKMKILVVCPVDKNFVTILKISTFMILKFRGFVSLAGARAKTNEEVAMLYVLKEHFS